MRCRGQSQYCGCLNLTDRLEGVRFGFAVDVAGDFLLRSNAAQRLVVGKSLEREVTVIGHGVKDGKLCCTELLGKIATFSMLFPVNVQFAQQPINAHHPRVLLREVFALNALLHTQGLQVTISLMDLLMV